MYYSISHCRFPIADSRFIKALSTWLQSAIGNWQSKMFLPARLDDAGNLPLQRQFTKTDTAEIKLPQISARTTTTLAARVGTHLKLWLARRLRNQ